MSGYIHKISPDFFFSFKQHSSTTITSEFFIVFFLIEVFDWLKSKICISLYHGT